MNNAEWEKVKAIFDEARDLPDDKRQTFLDESCGADAELRNDVERLLGAYKSDFLEETVLGAAQALINSDLAPGTIIGRYQIGELIGTGGMGQVYRAEDTELHRPVAFKVLHRDVAEDQERVRRFIQEARAASALNHPNILTIHEIGSFKGSRFIVSEFVDGETLRERMRRGISPAESVEIICQVATALKAAHAAGIVHRDIKPENVMLRGDGFVKVLDFGLAKLTEADDQPIVGSKPVSPIQTSPGLVMGTVAYMSPEQARGQAVDARTDLWSLGVVFHEMLTGRSPFEGDSVTDLIASIIKNDTVAIYSESLPAELRPICQKALSHSKESRYQSAHDLLKDLQGEKKRMEYAIESTAYISVTSTDDLKTQLIRRRPTLSAEYFVTSVKQHKFATLAAVLFVVTAGIGLSVYRFNGATPAGGNSIASSAIDSSTTAEDLNSFRVPSSGKMSEIAISPDGKYIAYVTMDGPGKKALRLRQRETDNDVEILQAPNTGDYYDLSFSPDSAQIYYRHAIPPFTANTINRIAVTGGPPTKLVTDVESGASLSPDGKMLVFNREVERIPGRGSGDAVIVALPDGSNERVLSYNGFNASSWLKCDPVPAWSPDGKSLGCYTTFNSPEGGYSRLTTINIADGATTLRDEKWSSISGITYMPDGTLVIVGNPFSAGRAASNQQLWLIAPNAAPKSITSDVVGYSNLSATRKGDMLLTIQNRRVWDLWHMRVGNGQGATQITNSGDMDHGGINWTHDGRILFSSNISGNRDIWIMNADGSGRKQLTRDHYTNMSPIMSADGQHIVFISTIQEGWGWHVFRMDADGSNLKQLTNGISENFPRISKDGKWVYFTQMLEWSGPTRLCKIPIEGGDPSVIATVDGRIVIHDIASNGNLVYEEALRGDTSGFRKIKLLGPNDREISKALQLDASTTRGLMQWSSDGRYVTFQERNKNSNFDVINGISISGKKLAKPLVTFSYLINNGSFGWSKDGKQIAFGRSISTSDAIMITKGRN